MLFHLVLIFIISTLTIFSTIISYSIDSDVKTDGLITRGGCSVIHGTLVTDTIDGQTVGLCKYNDKYFRLYDFGGCSEVIGQWKDPDTGKFYKFGAACMAPHFCDVYGTHWEIYETGSDYWKDYSYSLPINIEGNEFNINIQLNGKITCNWFNFIQEEKTISVISAGYDDDNSIGLTIPKELLSGDFKVLIDEKMADFKISESEKNSTIVVGLDFTPDNGGKYGTQRKIEIIGTQAIPEFPVTLLLLTISFISIILLSKYPLVNTKKFSL